jgi:hypothetical protein
MKKFLLSIAAVLSVSAFAQKDVETIVVFPETEQTYSVGDTAVMQLGIVNEGADDIEPTDTLWYGHYFGPYQIVDNNNNFWRGAFLNNALEPGDTAAFNPIAIILTQDMKTVMDTSQYGYSVCGRVELGLVTGSESNTSNNYACNTDEDVSVEDIDKRNNNISVYPNPVVNHMIISGQKDAKLFIQDATGRVVMIEELNEGENTINTADLANGTFIFKVVKGNLLVGNGKFVK